MRPLRGRRRGLIAAAVAAVLAVAGAVVGLAWPSGRERSPSRHLGHGVAGTAAGPTSTDRSDCRTKLRVVSAASYVPVLRTAVRALGTGADCVGVTVTVADGRTAADKVAATDADVWIPDDSSWASLPNPVTFASGAGATLATSPFYVVSQHPLPSADRTWIGLGKALQRQRLHLRISDPQATGVGMVGAGEMSTAIYTRSGPLTSALQLMRAWQHGSTVAATQVARPTAADQVAILPEYEIIRHHLAGDYQFLVPPGGPALMRFSWYPTAAGQQRAATALQRLYGALTDASARKALAGAGLRAGNWPAAAPPGASGLPAVTGRPLPPVPQHFMWHILTTWDKAARAANFLVVVDVSGSMGDPAPGTHTPLIDLVRRGVGQFTGLLPDNAEVGLWQFGARLDGPRDYQSLVPDAPLIATQRRAVGSATRRLAAQRSGTGLYDTVLAAYRYQQANFRSDIPTEVIVFTDGVNQDDPQTISLAQLKRGLAAADPAKRVQIGIFAFGSHLPVGALTDALSPVGGQVDQLAGAGDVLAAFVHADSGGLTH